MISTVILAYMILEMPFLQKIGDKSISMEREDNIWHHAGLSFLQELKMDHIQIGKYTL